MSIISKFKLNINKCKKSGDINFIFTLFWNLPFYYTIYIFTFPSVYALCVKAKQRIDGGFFLFKAEQKMKAEKKKIRKLKKTKNFMESSDDDFV